MLNLADNLAWSGILAFLCLVVLAIDRREWIISRIRWYQHLNPLCLVRRLRLALSIWMETQLHHCEDPRAGIIDGFKAAVILVTFGLYLTCVPAVFAYEYPVITRLPVAECTVDIGATNLTVYLALGLMPIIDDPLTFWTAVVAGLLIILTWRIPWALAMQLSRYAYAHPERYLDNFRLGYFGVIGVFMVYLLFPFCLGAPGVWRYPPLFLTCWFGYTLLMAHLWFSVPSILRRELARRGKLFPDSETSL